MSHPCSVCTSSSPCPSPERAWSRSLRTCMLLHPKVSLSNQWFSGTVFHDSLAAFNTADYSLYPEMLLSLGFWVISLFCFSSYFVDFQYLSVSFRFILSSGPQKPLLFCFNSSSRMALKRIWMLMTPTCIFSPTLSFEPQTHRLASLLDVSPWMSTEHVNF